MAGCPGAPSPDPGKSESPRPPIVSVETIDAAGLAQAVAQHRGKVVLVDFWATWCGPCKEGFPHTVALHRRFADKGLVVASVAMDELEDRDAVEKFLVEQKAEFPNYLSRLGVGEKAFESFGLSSGLPHLRLYDRQGNVARDFAGGGTTIEPEDVERAVEALLAP